MAYTFTVTANNSVGVSDASKIILTPMGPDNNFGLKVWRIGVQKIIMLVKLPGAGKMSLAGKLVGVVGSKKNNVCMVERIITHPGPIFIVCMLDKKIVELNKKQKLKFLIKLTFKPESGDAFSVSVERTLKKNLTRYGALR